jgi:acyl-CoA thioester hydrolase
MKRTRLRIDPGWDQFSYPCRVPFYATDAMGVVWHGDYLRFLEDARAAYFHARGISYQMLQAKNWGAPVVSMHIDWLQPARYYDQLEVRLGCIPNDKCLIETLAEIYRCNEDGSEDLLLRACCNQAIIDENGQVFVTRPPEVQAFFDAMETARRTRQENRS